jgi:hypothetical protein
MSDRLLPEIKCGHISGSPFVTTHLFTPGGTKLYTGSWRNVIEKTKGLPTCHGVTSSYRGGVVLNKNVDMFGKYSHWAAGFDASRLLLVHINIDYVKGPRDSIFEEIAKHAKGGRRRTLYYLVFTAVDSPLVIRSWRRMPSEYLRELQDFEQNLPKYELAARLRG